MYNFVQIFSNLQPLPLNYRKVVIFHLFCRVFKNNVPLLLKGEVKRQILNTLVKEMVRCLESEVIKYSYV